MKRSTPNYMVYGETGCLPLSIDINERIIMFWARLKKHDVNNHQKKLSSLLYNITYNLSKNLSENNLRKKFPWIANLRQFFINCGLCNIWDTQNFGNEKWLKLAIRQKLKDIFLNDWYSVIQNSSKSTFYRIFKKEFKFEKYLLSTPKPFLRYMIKFRTRNHRLPIETGNWARIPINQRTCTSCNNKIGDEFHYLFECVLLNDERKKFLKPYYYRRANTFKLDQLINTENKSEYLKLCKFVKTIILR